MVESFFGAAGAALTGAVTFTPCDLRPDDDGSGMLGACPVTFQIVGGQLETPELEPGCYDIRIVLDCRDCQPSERRITVPADGTHELSHLMAASQPLPPDTNPYVVSVGGISGIVTQEQIAAMVGSFAAGSYVHTQAAPSLVWTVNHNLGQQIVDGTTVFSLDYQVQYQNVIVECLNPNQCRLFFADPVAGVALIQR